jgi:glutathione S-transferase
MLRQLFSRPAAEREPEVIAEGRHKTLEELARFEAEMTEAFLAGPLGAADYTLYPMLALALRADRADPSLALATGLGPKTRVWMARIEALPYFAATSPPHWRQS